MMHYILRSFISLVFRDDIFGHWLCICFCCRDRRRICHHHALENQTWFSKCYGFIVLKLSSLLLLKPMHITLQCFFPQYIAQQIQTPMFLVNAAYDSWQVSYLLVIMPMFHTTCVMYVWMYIGPCSCIFHLLFEPTYHRLQPTSLDNVAREFRENWIGVAAFLFNMKGFSLGSTNTFCACR